ncbi:MAG: hypothetical protein K8F56_20155 [Rhodocyclaceae bacterium]|nr:hypothetical protein [Rhodocyclaceae bacterium]
MEVLFNLSGVPQEGTNISVGFSANGGATWTIDPASGALIGVGAGLRDGVNRRILWDAKSTLPPETFGSNFRAKVVAQPGGGGYSSNFEIDLRSGTYVEISAISSPQTAGLAFPVTFAVKGAGGATIPWNGYLSLRAPPSTAPGQVQVVNGVGTKQLVLNTPGAGVVLAASGGVLAGASNPFTVQAGATNCTLTWVDAEVRDGAGTPVEGATVHLDSGQACTTSASGACRLIDVAPGEQEAWAVVEGVEVDRHLVTVNCNPLNTLEFEAATTGCNSAGLTPVLFVPGIMGSTKGCPLVSPIPRMPGRPAQEGDWCHAPLNPISFHGVLDPAYAPTGWRTLVIRFMQANPGYELGCTLFPVPYDWRIEAPDAAAEYLSPKIQHALAVSGQSRVSIVAHSMGGLVARAYINGPDFPQPSNIDKLAMVGTPNHGAPMAYMLWEGGDPVLGDVVSETVSGSGFWLGLVDFYRRTSHALFETYYGPTAASVLPDDRSEYAANILSYRRKMQRLFGLHVPSVRQLLPTSEAGFDFLAGPDGMVRGIETSANTNGVVDSLNANLTRLTGPADPDVNKVRTKIIGSESEPTLGLLYVFQNAPNSAAEFWQDGTPRLDLSPIAQGGSVWLTISPSGYEGALGDGTVIGASAQLPPPIVFLSGTGSHASIVHDSVYDIVEFVSGIRLRQESLDTPEVLVPQLGLRVEGRAQPLLTSPAGQRLGVEPGTTVLFEEVPGGSVELAADDSSLGVESPSDGVYLVKLAGAYAGEFSVGLEYQDDSAGANASWLGFYNGTVPFSFAFSVDSQAPGRIDALLAPPPPTNLAANYSAGHTNLSWQASPDPQVIEYAVYSKFETDAHLALLGTSTVASFATGDAWAAGSSDPVRLYAVAARYGGGHEGFLSNVDKNDDRDHDGMVDAEETRRGTSVDDPDTDDDGLTDGVEDGIGANPFDSDTDDDGFTDGEEVTGGSNPLDFCSTPGVFAGDFETGGFRCWTVAVP